MSAVTEHEEKQDDAIPFFPDHALVELYVAIGVMVVLFVVGIVGQLRPVGLDPDGMADPMNTPLHAKPEWYFLFLYQMLKYVPEVLGVLIPIVGMLVVLVWPFIDRGRGDTRRARLVRIVAVVVLLIVVAVLSVLGGLS
jgi:cytochrome b6-f complex subunit 4